MTMNMKRNVMLIVAMCMVSAVAFAQKTIRVSTDKTDLVLKVSPKGRLYQVYLGDKLRNPADYDHLPWEVYASSDAAVSTRGHEAYAASGGEDFFEPAVAVTHADGNKTTYLYYQNVEQKAVNGGDGDDHHPARPGLSADREAPLCGLSQGERHQGLERDLPPGEGARGAMALQFGHALLQGRPLFPHQLS